MSFGPLKLQSKILEFSWRNGKTGRKLEMGVKYVRLTGKREC